jgi:tetratricopeptide (TPR) repeat protein
MKKFDNHWILCRVGAAVFVALAAHAPARAADDSLLTVEKKTIKGEIKSMSRNEVTLEKVGGGEVTFKVPEIELIRYAGEPIQFNAIRNQINNGGFQNALNAMDKLKEGDIDRAEAKQEMQYLRALCHARLALGGGFDVLTAGKEMRAFVKDNPDNYHVLPAHEILGDLLVAAQKYKDATEFYKALADSPFDEYKMRSGVATGRALLAEKKFAEAQQAFDVALELSAKATGPMAEAQQQAAMLGKAACLAETGNPDEGIKLVEGAIAKLPPEEADLHARAYVTLGNCYRKKPDNAKPALLAFLHVDVLYFSNPQAHAEALWNLAKLWNDIGKAERAVQATQLLKDRYPSSPWAKL